MNNELVTIFGGTGFVGRAIIRELCKQGFRVRAAVRNPHKAQRLRTLGDPGQVDLAQANLRFPDTLSDLCVGAYAVVNCVGLLYEKGKQSFANVHVHGAENLAEAAKRAGVQRFVQISAIGADEKSGAAYARTKAYGEQAVRTAFPDATILRPSIVFGEEDSFFNRFGNMARFTPALPLIGGGHTRMQPIYVGDLARAVAAAITRDDTLGRIYELGGPRIYSFKELMKLITTLTKRPRLLLPLPFVLMGPVGAIFDFLLRPFPIAPPLTGDQVEMLRADNVVNLAREPDVASIRALGITDLEGAEAVAARYLWQYRPRGQFGGDHV